MTLELQKILEHFGAYDMLKMLKTMFAHQAEHELLQTVRSFHACKQEEGQYVSLYLLKMNNYIDNLERLGHPMSLNLSTVNDLHAMLKIHEETLPKKNVSHALHAIRAGKTKLPYAPNPKITPPPKKDNNAKHAICHLCVEGKQETEAGSFEPVRGQCNKRAESSHKGTVEIGVDTVVEPVVPEDTPVPTDDKDSREVVQLGLDEIVQKLHDHLEKISVRRIRVIESVHKD
ncbi:hypothetical protein Tco_0422055 [Tanacetum coccineum]